ncbi:hypothetical protein AMJ49_05175 [Parcubacteria bacterium DG_74_2]|nr:MAG: hypothetical protein AMJ49_05175 [Parcubacteria bacterium DG_74_2]
MARICVFGDSIVYGAWDYEQGGWVQRLRKFLDEKNLSDSDSEDYFVVYNLGVSGNNSRDLLERFEFELKQRLKQEGETIIALAIGINDSYFLCDKNDNSVLQEEFRENIQKLIDIAQKFVSKVIFIGLTCVDESKVTPIPWDTNKSYKNEYIQKYNEIIKSVCKENNVYFIEIFEKWTKLGYKNLLEDGLHPNSKGHEKIFKIVKDFLIKNKIITLNFENSEN